MGRILSFPGAGDRASAADRSQADMTYEEFYQTYFEVIVRYLSSRVANRQDAEDLASQSFIYCYQHWSDYKPDLSSRKSWLFMVVQCRWKNYQRDRRSTQNLDDFIDFLPDEHDVISATTNLMAAREELAKALKQLPENQRKVVIMRYFGQLSNDRIAARLGTTEGNVRVLLSRGIKKLGTIMQDTDWEE